MARWEPDAQGRLREAALELFERHGFEGTTVADIAARAGLTERTFFRHFADKREVLFNGSETLLDALVSAVAGAPDDAAPLAVVAIGLEAAGGLFERTFAGRRRAVILANPELLERERVKLATMSAATAEALRARGVPAPTAALAGEAGVAVFHVAFERWVQDPEQRSWSEHVRAAFAQLRELTELSALAA